MTSCPYCDGPLSSVGVRFGYGIGACRACGSLACLDHVGDHVLAALYGDPGYYTGGCLPYGYDARHEGRDRRRIPLWTRRLEAIEEIAPGRRLLELGPGTGGFLRLAASRGWDVAAVDPYPVAELPGALFPSVEAAGAAGPYDSICLFDVLEHVRYPRLLLDQLHSVMSPNGCAAIGLPNVGGPSFRSEGLSWCEVKPPEHLTLPSADGLRRAAGRAGLAVVSVLGHFVETWSWEPLPGLLTPAPSAGPLREAARQGARILNRAARTIRTRLPAPAPERQDYVTWFLVRPAAHSSKS